MNLNEASFQKSVIESDVPVLVDFWAKWCPPCVHLGPTVEKVAEDYEGKARVFKVNTEEEEGLATKFSISSIPALLFFKDGKVVKQLSGVQSEEAIKATLDDLMGESNG